MGPNYDTDFSYSAHPMNMIVMPWSPVTQSFPTITTSASLQMCRFVIHFGFTPLCAYQTCHVLWQWLTHQLSNTCNSLNDDLSMCVIQERVPPTMACVFLVRQFCKLLSCGISCGTNSKLSGCNTVQLWFPACLDSKWFSPAGPMCMHLTGMSQTFNLFKCSLGALYHVLICQFTVKLLHFFL